MQSGVLSAECVASSIQLHTTRTQIQQHSLVVTDADFLEKCSVRNSQMKKIKLCGRDAPAVFVLRFCVVRGRWCCRRVTCQKGFIYDQQL